MQPAPQNVEGRAKCRRCGRQLKNPIAVAAGIGPVCAKKKPKGDPGQSRSARFEIVSSEPEKLIIKDVGPWDQFFTITNDAENVVADLVSSGQLKAGQRLFYYDSEGDLDELLVVDGKFAGFKHVPKEEPHE